MAENVKVNYIYADAEEKYVKAVVLYVDGDDIVWYDKDHQHKFTGTKSELVQFYYIGLIFGLENGSYVNAISCCEDNDSTLRFVCVDSNDNALFGVYVPFVTEE